MIDRLLDQGYASTDICSALISMLQGATGGAPSGPAKSSAAPVKPAFGGASAPNPVAKPAMAAATAVPKSAKPAPVWAKPVAYVKPKAMQAPPLAEVAERRKFRRSAWLRRPRPRILTSRRRRRRANQVRTSGPHGTRAGDENDFPQRRP